MKNFELLSPAGSIESLYAAVLNGCDAVYLGGEKFSARGKASNFKLEEIEEVLNYCHFNGVKVYVAVNTLIKENELLELFEFIKCIYEIGIDGIIIQDFAVYMIVNEYFKNLHIHSSTQMTIHNVEGVKFLEKHNFSRVVLPRELSLEDLKKIKKNSNIELEVFVHGALCICYSGQCLWSSLQGGRSGNRGNCAQVCRLKYKIKNSVTNEENEAYILSPKDICTIEYIDKFMEIGIESYKIEGRLKREEYVAQVTKSYRKAIDSYLIGMNVDYENEIMNMKSLFNREGFSNGYLLGNNGQKLMAFNTVKNTGLYLGKIGSDFLLVLKEDLSVKDGIGVLDSGFVVSKLIKNNKEVQEAKKGDKVKIYPIKYKIGDELYKSFDYKLNTSLKETFKNKNSVKKSLNLKVCFKVNEPFKITCIYDYETFEVIGDIVEVSKNSPLKIEKIEDNLRKTGEYPFEINLISWICFEEGYLKISEINLRRREILESILNYEKNKYKRNVEEVKFNKEHLISKIKVSKSLPEYLVGVTKEEQLSAASSYGYNDIIINPFGINNEIEITSGKYYIFVPNILNDEFDYVVNYINKYEDHIKGVITNNIGIISKLSSKIHIIGDYKLNILNSLSLNFFSKYLMGVTLSLELNYNEIKDMLSNNMGNIVYYLYGRAEVMITKYCPVKTMTLKDGNCKGVCKDGVYSLTDRMGENFPLKQDIFCKNHIYNCRVHNLLNERENLKNIGINTFRIEFLDESYEEVINILNSLKSGTKLENVDTIYTKGHYSKGIL